MHDSPTDLPYYELRPGGIFPDWNIVSSRHARDALLATLALYDPFADRAPFGPEEDKIRQTLLRHYLATGQAPSSGQLERASGLPEATIGAVLAKLCDRDLVVLDRDNGSIVGAYPFTDRDTEHRVAFDDREICAMCAIDALGASAMARRDSVITSQCRYCQTPLHIATAGSGARIDESHPAAPVVWIGRHYRDGCAANSLCTTMCFFCSDAHLQAWRAPHAHLDGFRLSLDEGLEVGRALFEPALSGAVTASTAA